MASGIAGIGVPWQNGACPAEYCRIVSPHCSESCLSVYEEVTQVLQAQAGGEWCIAYCCPGGAKLFLFETGEGKVGWWLCRSSQRDEKHVRYFAAQSGVPEEQLRAQWRQLPSLTVTNLKRLVSELRREGDAPRRPALVERFVRMQRDKYYTIGRAPSLFHTDVAIFDTLLGLSFRFHSGAIRLSLTRKIEVEDGDVLRCVRAYHWDFGNPQIPRAPILAGLFFPSTLADSVLDKVFGGADGELLYPGEHLDQLCDGWDTPPSNGWDIGLTVYGDAQPALGPSVESALTLALAYDEERAVADVRRRMLDLANEETDVVSRWLALCNTLDVASIYWQGLLIDRGSRLKKLREDLELRKLCSISSDEFESLAAALVD